MTKHQKGCASVLAIWAWAGSAVALVWPMVFAAVGVVFFAFLFSALIYGIAADDTP